MKNGRFKRIRRMQRQYHRQHPWRLSPGGLYVPHSYSETKPDSLSWWDDVGFILNKRRVIVWWRHPRDVYRQAIDDHSWAEAGDPPDDDWLFTGGKKNYRRVGKSRKKISSYTSRSPSEELDRFYAKIDEIRRRLVAEGIEFEVLASWKIERLAWADGITVVAPVEVRNPDELTSLAQLARRLLLRQTTLEAEFPEFRYGKADWLREQARRPDFAEECRRQCLIVADADAADLAMQQLMDEAQADVSGWSE